MEELADVGELWRDMCGKCEGVGVEGQGREGVVASVEHFLGKASIDDQDLGAKVEEHGVGFPVSDELYGVTVNAGA